MREKRTLPARESCAWLGHHASLRLDAKTRRTDTSTYQLSYHAQSWHFSSNHLIQKLHKNPQRTNLLGACRGPLSASQNLEVGEHQGMVPASCFLHCSCNSTPYRSPAHLQQPDRNETCHLNSNTPGQTLRSTEALSLRIKLLRKCCLRAPLAAREAKRGRTVGHGGRRRRGLSQFWPLHTGPY